MTDSVDPPGSWFSVSAALYARRAFELNPERSSYSRLMVEQQILSELSEDGLDRLYPLWFPN